MYATNSKHTAIQGNPASSKQRSAATSMADVSNSNSNNIWNAVDLAKLPNNWNARPDDMLGESQSSYLTNPRRRKMRTSWVVGVDF